MKKSSSYRPEIDGLRAVAVLPVLLYHAQVPGFSGGFIGVDVFFVISGFLITRILLRDAANGSFSYPRFYERRFRRLLPALTFVLVATLLFALPVLTPDRLERLGESMLTVNLFSSNLYFWWTTDYFATQATQRPLLHTWSLAVEEQFYLFFPPFLALVYRFTRTRIAMVLAIATALSLVLSIAALTTWDTLVFFTLPFRAWELAAGAILATGSVPAIKGTGGRMAGAALGLLMILVPVVAYDHSIPFPGLAALPPVFGTALFIHAHSHGSTPLGRFLSIEPWRTIGLISYSLYLWHWPILVLARFYLRQELLSVPVSLGLLALSIMISWASWRWVEAPFRSDRFSKKAIFGISATVLSLGALVGAGLWASDGLPQRLGPALQKLVMGVQKSAEHRACMKKRPENACKVGDPQAAERWVVLGDSHSGVVFSSLGPVAEARGVEVTERSWSACPPFLDVSLAYHRKGCVRHQRAAIEAIEANPPKRAILLARWAVLLSGVKPEDPSSHANLVGPSKGSSAETLFVEGLTRMVDRLRAVGVEVTLLAGTPELPYDVPSHLFVSHQLGVDPLLLSKEQHQERNQQANRLLQQIAERQGVNFVDLSSDLCPEACLLQDGGRSLFADSNHYSAHATEHFLPKILEQHL